MKELIPKGWKLPKQEEELIFYFKFKKIASDTASSADLFNTGGFSFSFLSSLSFTKLKFNT